MAAKPYNGYRDTADSDVVSVAESFRTLSTTSDNGDNSNNNAFGPSYEVSSHSAPYDLDGGESFLSDGTCKSQSTDKRDVKTMKQTRHLLPMLPGVRTMSMSTSVRSDFYETTVKRGMCPLLFNDDVLMKAWEPVEGTMASGDELIALLQRASLMGLQLGVETARKQKHLPSQANLSHTLLSQNNGNVPVNVNAHPHPHSHTKPSTHCCAPQSTTQTVSRLPHNRGECGESSLVLCRGDTTLQQYSETIRRLFLRLMNDGEDEEEDVCPGNGDTAVTTHLTLSMESNAWSNNSTLLTAFTVFSQKLNRDMFCRFWHHVSMFVLNQTVPIDDEKRRHPLERRLRRHLSQDELRHIWRDGTTEIAMNSMSLDSLSSNTSTNDSDGEVGDPKEIFGIDADLVLKRAAFLTFTDDSIVKSKLLSIQSAAHLYTISLDILERFQMERWCKTRCLFFHSELVHLLSAFNLLQRCQEAMCNFLPRMKHFRKIPSPLIRHIIYFLDVQDCLDITSGHIGLKQSEVGKLQFVRNFPAFVREVVEL